MAKTNLVIVESPAKARTIEKYLGKDFAVVSSFGHIRDLPQKGLGVDIEKNFEPTYELGVDKKKVAAELKKKAKGATVWLASDEDREGEAIAWHLCHVLGVDPTKTNRIVFHEITKPAILEAIEKPRTVDLRLVDAQQARRVLDRLVGYKLSPVLWKKVQSGLSAGRVQSVAVRLVVEREREIKAFESEITYKVVGQFSAKGQEFEGELDKKLASGKDAEDFLSKCQGADYKITDIATKPGSRNPGAPFTTSTLQQEAARKLGFSVRQTMTLAQRLYENGHITYMRTDSTNLAAIALKSSEQYISKNFGAKYYKLRQYKTKSRSAQEAHEAIRPTNFNTLQAGDDANQKKLYQLIWKRTVASQMAAAEIQKTEVKIAISKVTERHFVASGEVLQFDGFMKVYGGGKDDVLLPELSLGQAVEADRISATQSYSRPPARYSEASLVKKLEEMGIGRPSTYAPTISTVQDRGYVEKQDIEGSERVIESLVLKGGHISKESNTVITGADRAKLVPTHLAEITTDFLVKHFASIVDFDFTANTEEELDKIADGDQKWQKMIADFYEDFEPLLVKSDKVSRSETSKARVLGDDPKSGLPVIARYGRFGPMLQIGEAEKMEKNQKPQFASLPADTTLETVTLEQALTMFALPRSVGQTEDGQEIVAGIGRFGPYVKFGSQFVSIKDHDPHTIDEKTARQMIADKDKAAKDKIIQDFGAIKIIKGPYGPYITDGKKNARIPKTEDPAKLSEKTAKELLEKAPARRSRRKKS